VFVVGVFAYCLDVIRRFDEPIEAAFDVDALAHRADSNVILFIDPKEKCLVVIVEDGTARLPIFILKICY
jgi:hypothetical protein